MKILYSSTPKVTCLFIFLIIFSNNVSGTSNNWVINPYYNLENIYINGGEKFPDGKQYMRLIGIKAGYQFNHIEIKINFSLKNIIGRETSNSTLYRKFSGIEGGIGGNYSFIFENFNLGSGLYLNGCFDQYDYTQQHLFYIGLRSIFFLQYPLLPNLSIKNNISFSWNLRTPSQYYSLGYGIGLNYEF